MLPISPKIQVLTALSIAILSFASACSSNSQANNSTQNPNTADTKSNDEQKENRDGMNHGGMNHGGMNHGSGMNHNMDLGVADANYDLRFIDAMIPHHKGAVEMAKEAQQKSQRPEIKELADAIIKAQDREIARMQQWRNKWYPKASNTPVAYDSKTGKTIAMSQQQMQGMMMNVDLGASDREFDLRFINAMIPHHEAAVVMGKDAIQKSKRPEIKKLAQDIIASQTAEIEQMKQWRKTWYNQ